ncbi:hemolysin-III related [Fragilaria crotonensis]|nr:hemolysin-III related [Fragilaria crotonensis]
MDTNNRASEQAMLPTTTNYGTSEATKDGVWRFTDIGQVGERSRDGSPHATDEVFNGASHMAATMMSILGMALLVSESSALGAPWKIVSFSIYGSSLIFLFACSTLHHSISGSEQLELFLKMLDYLAIYPLIAGTFTPLCLVPFHDSTIGWSFCAVVWFLAIVGMIFTYRMHGSIPKWLSMTTYLTLGWLGALMSYWLWEALGSGGMGLFVLGGIFYTVGGYVYTAEKPNPFPGSFGFHEIWHVAVMLGAGTHWFLMYLYVLPWEAAVTGSR